MRSEADRSDSPRCASAGTLAGAAGSPPFILRSRFSVLRSSFALAFIRVDPCPSVAPPLSITRDRPEVAFAPWSGIAINFGPGLFRSGPGDEAKECCHADDRGDVGPRPGRGGAGAAGPA